MMNSKAKWLSATLMAALLTPVAVQAQTREIERERRDMREERRELRDAQRYGSPRDVREERREYADARHDYRDAKRDWRDDRRDDRRHAGWNAPFRYQRFSVGATLNRGYYAPAYRPAWDARWGVPHAGRALTYVRHYDDLLLVNMRSGKVVKVYRGHFRWR